MARLWILLSYKERRERFCRSWKASGRMQLILLAFKSLRAEPGRVVRGEAQHQTRRHVLGTFLGAEQAQGSGPLGARSTRRSGEPWLPSPCTGSCLATLSSLLRGTVRGAPDTLGNQGPQWQSHLPKAFGRLLLLLEFLWVPQAAEMDGAFGCSACWVLGEHPCLNSRGSRGLGRAWVSPCRDNSPATLTSLGKGCISGASQRRPPAISSESPLPPSGFCRTPKPPTALPCLPSPKLFVSSESHTPKRSKRPVRKTRGILAPSQLRPSTPSMGPYSSCRVYRPPNTPRGRSVILFP